MLGDYQLVPSDLQVKLFPFQATEFGHVERLKISRFAVYSLFLSKPFILIVFKNNYTKYSQLNL